MGGADGVKHEEVREDTKQRREDTMMIGKESTSYPYQHDRREV